MAKKIDMNEVKNLMQSLSISEEEAIELYKFDNDIEDDSEEAEEALQEVEKLTKKANVNKTNVRERSKVTNNNSKPKERKVDNEKKNLLNIVAEALEKYNIQIDNIKTETELSFGYNGSSYTFKLTKHRVKK